MLVFQIMKGLTSMSTLDTNNKNNNINFKFIQVDMFFDNEL